MAPTPPPLAKPREIRNRIPKEAQEMYVFEKIKMKVLHIARKNKEIASLTEEASNISATSEHLGRADITRR
jgi:hypothetical protein